MNKKLIPNANWIVYDPAEVLRTKCKDVRLPLNEELLQLTQKMITYIDASYKNQEEQFKIKGGIAIAAPQMNYSVNIIYIHFNEQKNDDVIEHKYLLANPKIVSESVQQVYLKNGEGCLSIRENHEGYVYRKKRIIIEAYDLLKKVQSKFTFENLLSLCFQHEFDHLNGILFYDRINKKEPFKILDNAIEL